MLLATVSRAAQAEAGNAIQRGRSVQVSNTGPPTRHPHVGSTVMDSARHGCSAERELAQLRRTVKELLDATVPFTSTLEAQDPITGPDLAELHASLMKLVAQQ
ncbi:MAG: hypothetical protein ACRDRO_21635 [Pseudonocardiaceae bacterium]